jgi:hypothetical protein
MMLVLMHTHHCIWGRQEFLTTDKLGLWDKVWWLSSIHCRWHLDLLGWLLILNTYTDLIRLQLQIMDLL